MRSRGQRVSQLALELVVPATAITAWWTASSGSSSLYWPSLSKILTALRDTWLSGHLREDALPSLEHLAAGYLLATVLGVTVGIAIGVTPILAEALSPIIEFLRAIPSLALVSVAILILGIGSTTQILIITSAAVWPILLNTVDGVRAVDPLVLDVSRSYRLTAGQRLPRVVLPAASPQIVAGMRAALSIGVIMIVFSEMVGATSGIGYQLLQFQRNFDLPEMWATMIFLGILGYLLNIAFRYWEHVVLRWHEAMRQTSD